MARPPKSQRAVNTRDIAAAAGVAQSTVSRALRNDPNVADAQRERIKEIARSLGYRPNPFVTAFTAQVLHYRRSPRGAVIAFIRCSQADDFSTSEYFQGASDRAHALGFGVEVFCMWELNYSFSRLGKVLQARGIFAVLILPVPSSVNFEGFPFEHFASAAVDPTLHRSGINRAEPHYFQCMELTLDTLASRGYKRIVFCTNDFEVGLISRAWLGAFDAWQNLRPRKERMEACVNVWGPEKVGKWFKQHRPDAIICNSNEYLKWANTCGFVPPEVAHVSLGAGPHRPQLAGVNQNRIQVAASAVDSIVAQIHRNEFGLPAHPKIIMIRGSWYDGESVRSS